MKCLKSLFFIFLHLLFISSFYGQLKINGLSLVASNSELLAEEIIPMQAINTNFIAVSPFGFSKQLNSPNVQFNVNGQWFGETNLGVKQYISLLKKNNLKIMLKPQLWVGHGKYTGFIKMDSDKDWQKFENSYRDFIINYAKLAQELNVEIFVIGTELMTFVQTRPKFWTSIITEIRKVYHGKITYAANWDEFDKISIWQNLDFIGLNAYFPLSDKKNPTVLELKQGWKTPKQNILNLVKKTKKPILFTEFGYRSVNYATKEPWNAKHVEGEVNLAAQKNALEALFSEFWSEDWFLGGFLWKWYANHKEVGGLTNNRYTPQKKPAEQVIKNTYKNYSKNN